MSVTKGGRNPGSLLRIVQKTQIEAVDDDSSDSSDDDEKKIEESKMHQKEPINTQKSLGWPGQNARAGIPNSKRKSRKNDQTSQTRNKATAGNSEKQNRHQKNDRESYLSSVFCFHSSTRFCEASSTRR